MILVQAMLLRRQSIAKCNKPPRPRPPLPSSLWRGATSPTSSSRTSFFVTGCDLLFFRSLPSWLDYCPFTPRRAHQLPLDPSGLFTTVSSQSRVPESVSNIIHKMYPESKAGSQVSQSETGATIYLPPQKTPPILCWNRSSPS